MQFTNYHKRKIDDFMKRIEYNWPRLVVDKRKGGITGDSSLLIQDIADHYGETFDQWKFHIWNAYKKLRARYMEQGLTEKEAQEKAVQDVRQLFNENKDHAKFLMAKLKKL